MFCFTLRCGIWDCFRLVRAADIDLPHDLRGMFLSAVNDFCIWVMIGFLGTFHRVYKC